MFISGLKIFKIIFLLITLTSSTTKLYAIDLNFNNGTENQYRETSKLTGINSFTKEKLEVCGLEKEIVKLTALVKINLLRVKMMTI